MMNIDPVTLVGSTVRLEPLSETHVPGLTKIAQDERIWKYLPYGNLNSEKKMLEHVKMLLERVKQGMDLPFAVIYLETGHPIGCTRYMDIRREHRALEIGGTWYGTDYQRTRVNTECKYLLLEHAFERIGCIRVQFKTDALNERSQRALERIGAEREGILRNHLIVDGGRIRDSVYYSILDREWPKVKALLETKLSESY